MTTGPNDRDPLEAAIRASRTSGEDAGRFSEDGRQRLFNAISRDSGSLPRLTTPFVPWARRVGLVLATAMPVLLLALPLGWRPAAPPAESAPKVAVSKVGDRVVFLVSNGGSDHQITKSYNPRYFDPSGAVRGSGGSFVDQLDSGPDLVFYRID